jgi:hypothetical protein
MGLPLSASIDVKFDSHVAKAGFAGEQATLLPVISYAGARPPRNEVSHRSLVLFRMFR